MGTLWLKIQWHRAELLRKLERDSEALAIEAELRTLLAYADDDHVIAGKLRRLNSK
jgi:hypothetical protein